MIYVIMPQLPKLLRIALLGPYFGKNKYKF